MQYQFELDPHDKDTIFLFCGRKNDRIKALIPLYVLPYVDNSSKTPEILAFRSVIHRHNDESDKCHKWHNNTISAILNARKRSKWL